MGKGFNTSNWLEAWWRISSNNYPDPSDYTRTKFQEFKNAGFTHVRLPVIFELISNGNAPYTLNTNHLAFKLVDSAIVWANDFNLKLIIDNHHGEALTDANFASEKLRKCAVWRQLVQRYGNLDPNRFMFELYNEPNGISNTNWRNIAQAIVDTIRSINTTHTLIIGGNGWNSINGMTSFTPLTDPNIIYTFHTYDPYLFTHQGMSWTSPAYFSARTFPQGNELNEIRSLFTTAKSWSSYYGVPIYMGEFGVGTPADATSRCNWVSHLTHLSDSLSIPWAYWDAKNYNDAFGFYPGGLAQANIIPCFKTALNLYSPTLAVSEITNAVANCNAKSIDIQWISEVTQRTGTFNIESSNDGFSWETVLSEKARLGQNRYKKSITLAQQQQYFRVVYVDVDGSKTTSAIMTSNCKLHSSLIVFPNPISEGELNIAFQVGAAKRVKINLINSNGQTIQQFDYQANAEDNNIKINTYDLAKGLYFIQLWTEDNEMVSTKLTVY
jgi:endoglucanase